MSYKGIDVSHYNKPINWDLVKNQIDFAILKLGNILKLYLSFLISITKTSIIYLGTERSRC